MWSDIHCGFDFSFPWGLLMLSTFSCSYWSFAQILWKNVYSVSLPILIVLFGFFVFAFLLLSCVCSLYILPINSLSDIWFVNIFYHSRGCLFILLILLLYIFNVFLMSAIFDSVSLIWSYSVLSLSRWYIFTLWSDFTISWNGS